MDSGKLDINSIFQQMSKFVTSITTEMNETFSKMQDLLPKIGNDFDDKDHAEWKRLFLSLTIVDRENFVEQLKSRDVEKIKEWVSSKTTNQKIINTVIAYTDLIENGLKIGNAFSGKVDEMKKDPLTGSIQDMMNGLFSNFGKETSQETPQETTKQEKDNQETSQENQETSQENQEDKQEDNPKDKQDDKQDDFMTNFTKFIATEVTKSDIDIDKFQTEISKMKSVINNMFSDSDHEKQPPSEVDDGSILYKTIAQLLTKEGEKPNLSGFNNIVDKMCETVFSEVTTKDTPQENQEEPKETTEPSEVKTMKIGGINLYQISGPLCNQEKVDKAVERINQYNKLSDEINDLTKDLNPFESAMLEQMCGGLPMNFRLRMLENRLESMDEKLTSPVDQKKHEEKQKSQEYAELTEKIDDIAINLNVLLSKLSKFFNESK